VEVIVIHFSFTTRLKQTLTILFAGNCPSLPATAFADETYRSPYMTEITGRKDFVYVWTLGVEGMGGGQDKLVTIDVAPGSSNCSHIVNTLSVRSRNEAHHSSFTDD
jgi:selenium-binding protein 1